MTVTYTVGDTREVIKTIPDGSVDLIASSPPFLALRSYVPADHESKGDEIGSERNPAEFIDMLLNLTAEWGRVLAPHGSIAIELGDTYSGSGGAGGDYNEGGLREGQPLFRAGYLRADGRKNGQAAATGEHAYPASKPGGNGWPRAKSLALIPQLYAVALAYGINPLTGAPSPAGRWLVRNVIVWHRPNPAVGALGDKVRPSTSYIVIATRSAKRWFDLTAVRTEAKPHSLKYGDAVTRARHGNAGYVVPERGDGGRMTHDLNPDGSPPLDAWFDTYDGTHDTWTLTTQPSRLAHYAMWPAKLAERLILSMCPREVCRICGEPRRRIEKETDAYAAEMGDRLRDDTHNGRTTSLVRNKVGDLTHIRRADTLGWTDCGHRDESITEPDDATRGVGYRPGLVLDPFAGSGTTLAVADLHGRDAIGIDFDQRNHDLYPARYDEVKKSLYGTPAPMPGQGDLFAEVAG